MLDRKINTNIVRYCFQIAHCTLLQKLKKKKQTKNLIQKDWIAVVL